MFDQLGFAQEIIGHRAEYLVLVKPAAEALLLDNPFQSFAHHCVVQEVELHIGISVC